LSPQVTDRQDREIYAIIAMGTNQPSVAGGSEATILAALEKISQGGYMPINVSNFYETPSFPKNSGPDYVNAAVAVTCETDPETLLEFLHDVEASFGRVRDKRWSARTLDLDLLAMGDAILPNRAEFDRWFNLPMAQQTVLAPEHLILPHPRLHERAFVLVPMADIANDWMHPILGKTVGQMLADLPQHEIRSVKRLPTLKIA
jgi:2-amino-4-hydroxy-6-hydroxymethyldihydropteridine diphosphokinase